MQETTTFPVSVINKIHANYSIKQDRTNLTVINVLTVRPSERTSVTDIIRWLSVRSLRIMSLL